MQEAMFSLIQMASTAAALGRLREARLPYISVLTNPTTGGVAASLASLGDINIGEPNALIGFTGPRVIEQTIGTKLPQGFQRSEFLLEHGTLDMIVDRREMRQRIHRLLKILMQGATAAGTSPTACPIRWRPCPLLENRPRHRIRRQSRARLATSRGQP